MSSCIPGAEVELYQDGISLGRKELKECRAFYQAEYKPGKLEAVSFDGEGKELGRTVMATAGEVECLTILPEAPMV